MECAKWFEGENSLVTHRRGKTHKRRVKDLKAEPYTQKEAESVVGIRPENAVSAAAMMKKAEGMEVEMDGDEEL